MKTKKQKKAKKPASRAKRASRKMSHEIVVRVQTEASKLSAAVTPKDIEPEKDGVKYMIPKSWISDKQVIKMVQKTPPQHVYQRPAKGGGQWSYVTGIYIEKVLNFVFGWNWDFEIIAHGVQGEQVWVQGKLTVKDDAGHSITKSQFGRADIKFKKDSKIMLDFGNDLKAASTDALKKCASLLGIASDIYGKAEFKQEANVDVRDTPPQPPESSGALPPSKNGPDIELADFVCHGASKAGCGNDITKQEAEYSRKIYGKPLCRECQAVAKPR